MNTYANPVHEGGSAIASGARRVCRPASAARCCPRSRSTSGRPPRSSTRTSCRSCAAIWRIWRRARRHRGARPLLIMQSNGGVMTARRRRPADPHDGVRPGGRRGRRPGAGAQLGLANLITFDMGGTTAKASIVEDGAQPGHGVRGRRRIGTARLFSGGGYPLRVPAIDIAEVGPAAAAWCGWSRRRPAGRAGQRRALPGRSATAWAARAHRTDANVVLGYLNPTALVGGALKLNAARRRGLPERVAEPLGLRPPRPRTART